MYGRAEEEHTLQRAVDMGNLWLKPEAFGIAVCRAGEKHVQHAVDTGMKAYRIQGISFTMATTAGPISFSPLFTSKRTAKLSWVSTARQLLTHFHPQAPRQAVLV